MFYDEEQESQNSWLSKCYKFKTPGQSEDIRCRIIFYSKISAVTLSIFGCSLALFIIIIYRKYRHFTHRMVTYILAASIFDSCLLAIPADIENTIEHVCLIAGFFVNWGFLALRLLILCIAVHILLFTIDKHRPKYFEAIFLFFVCLFSLGISIVPLLGYHYGPAGDWCWIKGETRYENNLRILCQYVWIFLSIFIEVICYIIVIYKMHKQLKQLESGNNVIDYENKKNKYMKNVYPLLFYPLVNFVLAIPVTANRIQNYTHPGSPVFGLFLCHSTIYPLWGFCNAMTYFITKGTINEMHPLSVWDCIMSRTRQSTITLDPPLLSNDNADPDNLFSTDLYPDITATEEMRSSESNLW